MAQQHVRRVIIVGGGLAGHVAALEAYHGGACVLLFEKEARCGGNSAKASSGVNAVRTPPQQNTHVKDTSCAFIDDIIRSGDGLCSKDLVEILVHQSRDAWDLLTSWGVNLNLISKCGGHSFARTHRSVPRADGMASSVGWDVMKAAEERMRTCDTTRMKVVCQAHVDRLLVVEGCVRGVRITITGEEPRNEWGDAVILATGGFGHDKTQTSLLHEFAPEKWDLPTTNGEFTTGDGIKMARAIGAHLRDMDKVQVHPTGLVDPNYPSHSVKFLIPEAIRAAGAILVNQTGKRFVDELAWRNCVSQAMFECCEKLSPEGPVTAFLILNEAAVVGFNPAVVGYYVFKGFAQKFDDAAAVCAHLRWKKDVFQHTLELYNEAAHVGHDEFGKNVFPVTFSHEEPLYVLLVTPSIHYCMGGVRITRKAEVLGRVGESETAVIPGLYAAGEVSSGVHGANRLAGNSMLECVVFGKIAGRSALT